MSEIGEAVLRCCGVSVFRWGASSPLGLRVGDPSSAVRLRVGENEGRGRGPAARDT
jgi:hypothetical protein